MGYTYTCSGCDSTGDTPALMGQFNKETWFDTPFGDRIQSKGYELGDTITLCPTCTYEFLEAK